MARMTKAERLEREAAAAARWQQEQAAAYPQRLMHLLERACKFTTTFKVKDGKFELKLLPGVDFVFKLDYQYTPESDDQLDALRWRVEQFEEELAEERRVQALRESGRAKLSQEEADALGL